MITTKFFGIKNSLISTGTVSTFPQPKILSAKMAWGIAFTTFICAWLLLGDFVGQLASDYTKSNFYLSGSASSSSLASQLGTSGTTSGKFIKSATQVAPSNFQSSNQLNNNVINRINSDNFALVNSNTVPDLIPNFTQVTPPSSPNLGSKLFVGGVRVTGSGGSGYGMVGAQLSGAPNATWEASWTTPDPAQSGPFDQKVIQLVRGAGGSVFALTWNGSVYRTDDGKNWTTVFASVWNTYTRAGDHNFSIKPKVRQLALAGDQLYAAVNIEECGVNGFYCNAYPYYLDFYLKDYSRTQPNWPSTYRNPTNPFNDTNLDQTDWDWRGRITGDPDYMPSNGVYVLDGSTFKQIYATPLQPVNRIGINGNLLWILAYEGGNSGALYISKDLGQTFQVHGDFKDDFPAPTQQNPVPYTYYQPVPVDHFYFTSNLYADPSTPEQFYVTDDTIIHRAKGVYPGYSSTIIANPSIMSNFNVCKFEGGGGILNNVVVDPAGPSKIWMTGYGENCTDATQYGLFKTVDGGQTWQSFSLGGKYNPLLRANDGTLWLGAGVGPYNSIIGSSTDEGNTWVDQTGNYGTVPGLGVINDILPAQVTETPSSTLGPCPCGQGKPINPATGNFYETFNDLNIAPASNSVLSLNIVRTYNSQDDTIGLFGKGWHFTYDMQLVVTATNVVTVINSTGRQDPYIPLDDGTNYITPPRANAKLIKSTNAYTLTTADQLVYNFDLSGKLLQISDRNGNQFTLSYNNPGSRLSAISEDNYGRSFSVVLNPSNNFISSITDNSSNPPRVVSYGYDANNRLTTVTDVRQKITRYNYDSNGHFSDLYDPDAQGNPNGNLVLHNVYDDKGRVLTQTTYTAAGTSYNLTFDYTSLTNHTIVTNQRGYTTTYTIDPLRWQPIAVQNAQDNKRSVTLNSNDNATKIVGPNGVTQASYNEVGKPTGIATSVKVQNTTQIVSSFISYTTKNDPAIITDTRGFTTTFHYTPAGNPDVVTDTLGQATQFSYDVKGRISSVTAANGLITNYHYDETTGLPDYILQTYATLLPDSTTLSSPHTYRTNFQYNSRGWLTSQSDPFDTTSVPNPIPVTTYDYDEAGHILTTTNQLNQKAYNQYDAVGNLRSSINFMGQQTLYDYDWQNRLVQSVQVLASGNLTTTYSYDGVGNLLSRNETRDSATKTTITTNYEYDNLNQLITTTMPLQAGGVMQTVNSYDPSGNVSATIRLDPGYTISETTRYQYDELNRVVTTTLDYGDPSIHDNYQTINIYDLAGNITETRRSIGPGLNVTNWTDPAQVVTSGVTYDALSRPLSRSVNAWTAGNGNNILTTRYIYTDTQNLSTMIDPYGIASTSQTDPAGRTISSTTLPSTSGSSGAPIQNTYSFYDPRGLLIRQIDPVGNWTDQTYDLLGRASSTTQYTGVGGTGIALTTNTYYQDGLQPKVVTVGPAPHYSRQDSQYDEAGRLIASTVYTNQGVNYPATPGGALMTSYGYDGQANRISMIDPNLHQTQYGYENPGWLTVVTETVSGASRPLTTSYQYSYIGNLIQVRSANGGITQYSYDRLNRVTGEYDPESKMPRDTYYDGLGRVIGKVSFSNNISYTYDNASRLVQQLSFTYLDTNTKVDFITTTYNYNAGGQPLTMVDKVDPMVELPGTSTQIYNTTYTYDGLNRLVKVINPNGEVDYGYDKANYRTSMNFGPIGGQLKSVSYGYDGLSRPVSITNWASPAQTLYYTYNGARLNVITYPNATKANYSFDGANRLTNITHTNTTTNNPFFTANYTIDALGNRTGVSEVLNGQSRNLSYSYDELSRLTQEVQQQGSAATSHLVTSTYQYDGNGNRKQQKTVLPSNTKSSSTPLTLTTTYNYNLDDWLISRSEVGSDGNFKGNSFTYGYDGNGNIYTETNTLVSSEVITYDYDTRSRLAGWQKGKGSTVVGKALFSYDGNNIRLWLNYNGQTTNYLQDAAGGLPVVLQESRGSQTNSFLYPLGSTSPLFQQQGTGAGNWYHPDGLGSVRLLTDGTSNAIVNSYSYSAFGQNVGEGGKAFNDHLFAGEQLDPTGLYFNRARYYSPSLGRFIGRDSFDGIYNNPLSFNHFVYVKDNPLSWIDPSGNYQVRNTTERQVLYDACLEAISRGLDPRCDIPSAALEYIIHGILMILTPAEASAFGINPQDIVNLPRAPTGSRRDVGFRGRFYADMATRRDGFNPFFNLLCDPAQFIGGLYEVEPDATLWRGLIQLYTYVLAANGGFSTQNSTGTYSGMRWRAGTGMIGYNNVIQVIEGGAIVDVLARYTQPGIILFRELTRRPIVVTTPTPAPNTRIYPPLVGNTPTPNPVPIPVPIPGGF